MKTLLRVLALTSFLSNSAFGFMGLEPPAPHFGPDVLRTSTQESFGKPNQMFSILRGRPVSARDKHGNRLYYTTDGKMTLKINMDGSQVFSVSGKTVMKDAAGNVTQVIEKEQGTDRSVVLNDKGEVLGYQTFAYGNKIVAEFDKDGNKTKSYTYDEFGKNTEFVLNELTRTKTVFNKKGEPVADTYNGHEIAWYHHDDRQRLDTKTDIQGNVTYFDDYGNMTHTVDQFNNVVLNYNYTYDRDGNYILDTSVDMVGNVTTYKHGKPLETKSGDGTILVNEWHYDGQTLVYSVNYPDAQGNNPEVTWYDIDGKTLYTTHDDQLSREWLYSKGKMVGIWNEDNKHVTIFEDEREVATIYFPNSDFKPTGAYIQQMIDEGLVTMQMVN